MSYSVYEAAVPPVIRSLGALSKILDKAVAQSKAADRDVAELLEARLAPDMHPLTRQIQMACDGAKFAAARLGQVEPPSHPDTETTFPELQQRIAKTIAFLESLKAEQFEGAEDRMVELKFPSGSFSFVGRDYLGQFALPHFYFHVTTAYGLLRHKGIEIGKADYLGY